MARKRKPTAVRRVAQALVQLGVTAIAISFVWVLTYGLIAPRETYLMGVRERDGMHVTREWLPIEAVSPHLVMAVIAAEDARFCQHSGFDMKEIRAALEEAENGGRMRGASTLSQQVSKNVFLWPGQTLLRKGTEAWFTVLIEIVWGKERILEVYLNVAEWGDGHFGAESAARHLFGKSAADVTSREAALLAAILPSPNKWSATTPGPYVRRRASQLQGRMADVERLGLSGCVRTAGG